jgi:hypothetical protein
MNHTVRLVAWAFCISFLGSLPVGTLNVTVSGLVVMHYPGSAIEFGVAALGVEVLLVRVALAAVAALGKLERFSRIFGVITIVILLIFATFSLRAAWLGEPLKVAATPLAMLPPLAAGLVLSLLNPLHLPFWMGWSAALRSKGILAATPADYNFFILGIGLGTALAFFCYGMAGVFLQTHIMNEQPLINGAIGVALLGTAILQAYKLIPSFKRAPADRKSPLA